MIRPIFLALSLVIAALSAGFMTPPAAAAEAPSTYRLRPEDVIEITVIGPAQLDKTVAILPDGTITYPRLGTIKAEGKTPEELKAFLLKGLDRYYNIVDITVSVKELRSDRVTVNGGAVKTPGIYQMRRGWTVHELLAAAGGLVIAGGPPAPDQIRATLHRKSGERVSLSVGQLLAEKGAPELPALQPDDVLTVEDLSIQIWVDGQVKQPGSVTLPPGASVLEALKLAGGPTEKAALSKATIRRSGSTQHLEVDLRAALNGGSEPLPALQRLDTLTIPENKNQVVVLGGVQKSGPILIPEGETLHMMDVIALAGTVPYANLSQVILARKVNGQPVSKTVNMQGMFTKNQSKNQTVANLDATEALQPGDVIYVPDPKRQRTGINIMALLGFASLFLP
jgi:polysaccharide export outer membrane protein